MTDTAGAQDLPDVGSLQPPPDLPDVGSLTEAQTLPPMRGIAGMPNYSSAVVARLRNGDPVSRVIGKLADGFATGYGNAFSDITAEDQATMAKAGYKPVTPEEMGTIGGTLRFFGHALMDDVSRVKAGVLSIFPAAVEAVRQGVTQGAKEVGLEAGPGGTAEQTGEGAAGFAEFMGTDASIQTMLMSRAQYAEATRIMPNPAGGHFDQRIGPVPDHIEAAQQAAQVADHYGLDIAPAVTEAYGKGILPAEIHADAKTNPTILPDLAEGKAPEAYPVSDWTGQEVESQGKTRETSAEGQTGPVEAPVPDQQEGAPQPSQAPGRAVPTRLRPIEGTGELTPMQLSQSVEEAVGKEFEGVPASRVASNEVQEAAARKFVDLDPERADQVAMFGATPPKNLLGQMVYNEVVRRAAATGDFDKLRMLATQSTQPGILRRSGQEIQAASQLGDGNAAADMTRVHEARQAALKAQGVDVAANENAAAAEYAPIRAATRAAKGPDAWAKFLAAIQCAE